LGEKKELRGESFEFGGKGEGGKRSVFYSPGSALTKRGVQKRRGMTVAPDYLLSVQKGERKGKKEEETSTTRKYRSGDFSCLPLKKKGPGLSEEGKEEEISEAAVITLKNRKNEVRSDRLESLGADSQKGEEETRQWEKGGDQGKDEEAHYLFKKPKRGEKGKRGFVCLCFILSPLGRETKIEGGKKEECAPRGGRGKGSFPNTLPTSAKEKRPQQQGEREKLKATSRINSSFFRGGGGDRMTPFWKDPPRLCERRVGKKGRKRETTPGWRSPTICWYKLAV